MVNVRSISWVKQAKRDFLKFPAKVRHQIETALNMARQGEKADSAKPLSIFGSGVFEIALKYRSDAYRAVYALKIGRDVWVIHAFQKKSKKGKETPKPEYELITARIKTLRKIIK